MITPSCDEILELAKAYTTIPVCREIYADMTTPISLLRRLQTRSDRFFLLESVEGGEKWARYSFLGYDPILRATCKNGTVTLEGTVNKTVKTDKPLTVLREVLGEYRAPRLEGLPPFTGGFVGYFAYAMLGYAEPTLKIKRGAWDDFDLMLEPGCALDGKRLMDTSLRKKYGVTVVGIRHAGQIIPSPGGDAFLHGDDTVFLMH